MTWIVPTVLKPGLARPALLASLSEPADSAKGGGTSVSAIR
jgi:hypothetical protein